MVLILTNQEVFVTLSVVTIPPLAQGIFILTRNQAYLIGDQSDAVTQNAWFRCALCAAISGDISILIQTGAESWGRFPVPRICRWESIFYLVDTYFLVRKHFFLALSHNYKAQFCLAINI